jgi:benzil reductase ((S)-benzoin forming)
MHGDPDRVALVTGTSSGIGDAVARELLRRGWRVVGASRRPAAIENPLYSHVRVDLGDLASLPTRLGDQVDGLLAGPAIRRALVNNAADPGLLGTVDRLDPLKMLGVYAVNTAAPVALMGWFVRRARPGVAVRIVNVSTGAAVDPFPGLGAYGNTKAALRMAGRVLAAELDAGGSKPPLDVTLLSYEPGIVDTEMQAMVRESSAETVPMVEFFLRAKAEGRLVPPSAPAAEIADYLDSDGHERFTERRYGRR